MKYTVTTYDDHENKYETIVSCRLDASTKTLYRKCMSAICSVLRDSDKIPDTITYGYDLPNVWTNGAIGALWIKEPFLNVSIIREDGCRIAL